MRQNSKNYKTENKRPSTNKMITWNDLFMGDKSYWSVENTRKDINNQIRTCATLRRSWDVRPAATCTRRWRPNENVGLRTAPCHLYKHFRWTQLSLLLLDTHWVHTTENRTRVSRVQVGIVRSHEASVERSSVWKCSIFTEDYIK